MSDEPKINPVWRDDVPCCRVACVSHRENHCVIDGCVHHVCNPTVKQMAEKIRELEAVAARYPLTADKERVTPSDVLWHPRDGRILVDEMNYDISGWARRNTRFCECYSTKVAMEAAENTT